MFSLFFCSPIPGKWGEGLVSQREHGTKTEQSFYWSRREPAHIEIRKENQLESAGGHVFSLN